MTSILFYHPKPLKNIHKCRGLFDMCNSFVKQKTNIGLLISLLHSVYNLYIFAKTNLKTMAKKLTNNEILLRMAQVRCKWKFKQHTAIYESHYGVLDEDQKAHVHAVWSLHKVDELVVRRFEKIIESI